MQKVSLQRMQLKVINLMGSGNGKLVDMIRKLSIEDLTSAALQ